MGTPPRTPRRPTPRRPTRRRRRHRSRPRRPRSRSSLPSPSRRRWPSPRSRSTRRFHFFWQFLCDDLHYSRPPLGASWLEELLHQSEGVLSEVRLELFFPPEAGVASCAAGFRKLRLSVCV